MNNNVYIYLYTLILITAIGLYSNGCIADTATVVKVVDGDTIKVRLDNGKKVNLRLAGIDTPETYNNSKAKKDLVRCNLTKKVMFGYGKQAKMFLKGIIYPGSTLYYTVLDTGYYGRPVVYIPGVNRMLVKSGNARVVNYYNLDKATYSKLKNAEQYAMDNNLGIWKVFKCWR